MIGGPYPNSRNVDMPMVVVLGEEFVLRRRAVQSVLGGRSARVVNTADELGAALAPVMFGDAPPIWVRDLTLTESMLGAIEQYEDLVVVEIEGEPTAKSPLGKRRAQGKWVVLPTPKPWERKAQAIDFVRQEALFQNIILPDLMAATLVAAVGPDLGVLVFELSKLAMYSKQEGQMEITPKVLSQTLGGFVEVGMDELVQGVGQRNVRSILSSLSLIERTHGVSTSTVLRVCATLIYHTRIWLCCKTMYNGDPNPLGERLGIHPFVLRKQHFPHASKWDEIKLLALIAGVASVGRAVRQGCILPHMRLQGVLLSTVE